MKPLKSRIKPDSEAFKENAEAYEELIRDLKEKLARVRRGGPAEAVARHRKRGKLTVRERIERLKDPASTFLELSPMAAHGLYEDEVPAAGIVTGVIRVCERECVVVANDATVKGGTYYPVTVKKHLRAQEIALENRLPTIYLADSGGAFLPMQDEVFPDKEHFGRIFYNQALLSSLGVPQIAAVMGMCTAGGAYVPAMCDENVIVQGTGTIYLGGPPLVKAATGEAVSSEELGGAELHAKKSGVTDHLAADDAEALEIVRDIVRSLPRPRLFPLDRQRPEAPLYPPEEIPGVIPKNRRRQYDVREVIARLVDGSRFHEFKKAYGPTLVCGFARWEGFLTGIVANNGILFSEAALKGAHFVELCGQRGVPLIFLQNIAGFMVGRRYEEGGIAKDGAKMVQAVSTAPVPRFTLLIGGSHGAGNYAMCGRGYLPRFLFSWPNARISVMGAEQAAMVMVTIKEEQLERQGKHLSKEEAEAIRTEIREKYEREGHPYYATARLWDDGIITPTETRQVIARCLEIAQYAPIPEPRFPVFRM